MVNGMVAGMATGRSKKRRTPPSRLRYEASHPTVTVRVTRELYDELADLKAAAGLSVAGVLRIGLDRTKASNEKAYWKGSADGWELAKQEYEVEYPCSICGKPDLSITTDVEKASAFYLMSEAGWHHADCEE